MFNVLLLKIFVLETHNVELDVLAQLAKLIYHLHHQLMFHLHHQLMNVLPMKIFVLETPNVKTVVLAQIACVQQKVRAGSENLLRR